MSDYVLSREAREEARGIWDFIAQDDMDVADRWMLKLVQAFQLLARNPRIGHTRKDLTDRPVFFWPVDRYLIIYRLLGEDIEILALTQGARDIPSYLRRRT